MTYLTRRLFTLVELLIVIALLTLIAGVVGFNLSRMLQEQRFKTGVARVADHLQVAQELMLILSSPVKVTLTKHPSNPNAIVLTTQVDLPFNTPLARYIQANPTITGISSVGLQDSYGVIRPEPIEILFYPQGRQMTRGILWLSGYDRISANGSLKRAIPLAGYPQEIVVSGELPPPIQANESEELYPKEVREEFLLEKQKGNQAQPTTPPAK
jgi:Tfp pilus assembly protein FimT